jgi:hypothetical protein
VHLRLIELVIKFIHMKYLKIASIVSFLFIEGTSLHGVPTFAAIFLCIYQFLNDIITLPHHHEVSWMLGLIGFSAIVCLLAILFSRRYKDRILLILAFIALTIIEGYISGIFNYHKITVWFVFPLLIFIVSSVMLVILNFKFPKKSLL